MRGPLYNGNKAAIASWIVSLLPSDTNVCYVEPFAGMLGVLLRRPTSKQEIANDLNDRIVNWWQVLRDKPDALMHKCIATARSEVDFQHCWDTIDEGTDVERAAKLFSVLNWSRTSSDANPFFQVDYDNRVYSAAGRQVDAWLERHYDVARRMRNVQLLHRDAIGLLDDCASRDYAVIYCDPPYHSTAGVYRFNNLDVDAFTEALQSQRGRVAISGSGDEWDHLGWQRHEREKMRGSRQGGRIVATEVLWTNYFAVEAPKLV